MNPAFNPSGEGLLNYPGGAMLVLSRKVGEIIVIDEQIQVEVLEVNGSRVRIGISAPRNVNIKRGELSPQEREEIRSMRQRVAAMV